MKLFIATYEHITKNYNVKYDRVYNLIYKIDILRLRKTYFVLYKTHPELFPIKVMSDFYPKNK